MHLSTEELSEVAEGRQESAQGGVGPTQDVARHLRECAQCRDEADAMAELLAALADLEQPTLPQDVALRIDAALAQAALTDAPSPDTVLSDTVLSDTASLDTVSSSAVWSAEPESGPASVGGDIGGTAGAVSQHSHASRRPPSPLASTRRPPSRHAPSRRPTRRVLGWTVGSLLVVGGLAGLASVIGSQNSTNSSGTASAASGAQRNPTVQNGLAGDAAAQRQLEAWTRSVLASASPFAASSGNHADALPKTPTSSLAAASIAQCEADPKFADRHVVAASYGLFGSTPAVLVVYANGDGSPSVYAVAYQVPCTSSGYTPLAEGAVPD